MWPPLDGPIDPPPLKIAPYFFFCPLLRRIFPLWRASRRRIEESVSGTASARPLVSPNPGRVMDRPRADSSPVSNRRTVFAPPDTGRSPSRYLALLHPPSVSFLLHVICCCPFCSDYTPHSKFVATAILS